MTALASHLADWLGPIMVLAVLAGLFSGYPVAFVLGGISLAFAVLGVWTGYFDWPYLLALADRTFGVLQNPILLAIPYFILMGTLLQRSRLAEDLLTTIGALFGGVRGGLAIAVVGVGALLAAATGVVGASVVAMGTISLPVMLRAGYGPRLSTGVITAAGSLGQLIPPSVVLIVLGDQLGVSVGALFRAALIPGVGLALAFALTVAVIAWRWPEAAPPLPASERPDDLRQLAGRVGKVLVPPLLLIGVVLGSIFAGVATPTEAGALGAVGAALLAAANRRLSLETVREAARDTARLTTMVVTLLLGSTAFALVFRGLYGDLWIEEVLTGLPGGPLGFLIAANLAVFVLGFVIDFFEIAFIVVPLLAPAAAAVGIDLVWFGVMLGLNLQTSFLTPPFGFALFYLRGVAPPEVRTADIYRGVIPFVIVQVLALAAFVAFSGVLG
ncbi:MAG TPA: TRAP transporter large permease subunit [Bacteroidetes bacterium]|nr:TRAP transporter large permease subunit [Bacteroidota bacterium]HIL57774.1 TRAP transporter large permease subunit [Rhodothermales bacterium]